MAILTKLKFKKIIKLASQPVQEVKKKEAQKQVGHYTDKKTHQPKSVNTSD